MTKSTEARNHHWVPQCYLKGFAKSRSKNAKLFVVDLVERKTFATIPRNVASGRDFNRIEVPGVAPNQIESDFAKFEGLVAHALDRMDDTKRFGNAEDHNLILNLIALLSARNPRMRENSRSVRERVAKIAMSMTLSSKERYESSFKKAARDGFVDAESDITYEAMREFVERGEYTFSVSTTSHVDQELKLVNTILPLLGARTWMLITAPQGAGGFVTTDHPVVLAWSEKKDRGIFSSPGFALRGTEVIFAVSHDLVMVGSFEGRNGVIEATADVVAQINGIIAGHSERQIYAKDDRFRFAIGTGEIRRGADILREVDRPD